MEPKTLNDRMKTLNLTGAKLARMTGVHPHTISRWRTGKKGAKAPKWLALLLETWLRARVVAAHMTDLMEGRG